MNNYDKCMQNVINEIETNLEYVTIENLTQISGYSYYHFHRVFKAYMGESLKKYIKRLQLERALQKMQSDKENITQLAIEAGFNMSSSFNKAFKEMFDINPTQHRQKLAKQRESYKDIEPIKIIDIKPIEVYTIRHIGDYELVDISWNKIISFATKYKLFNRDFSAYGITYDNPNITKNEKLRYDVCITKTKDIIIDIDSEIYTKTIDGGKYAIFLHKGNPINLIDFFNSIFGKWFYKSDLKLRDAPVLQKMLNNKSKVSIDELLIEVHIPIE